MVAKENWDTPHQHYPRGQELYTSADGERPPILNQKIIGTYGGGAPTIFMGCSDGSMSDRQDNLDII